MEKSSELIEPVTEMVDAGMDMAEGRLAFLLGNESGELSEKQKAEHADAIMITGAIIGLVQKLDHIEDQLFQIGSNQ